jgi:hypothetical protein
MIVNPQLFNYRLILSSLIVTIAVIAVFSFNNYKSISSQNEFLNQEKKLIEGELSQIISRYDNVSSTNTSLSLELENAKQTTKIALDSLRLLNSDLSVLFKYKQQAASFNAKYKMLFSGIESLESSNETLKNEAVSSHNELEKQVELNLALTKTNFALNKTIDKASLLSANSFKANAYNSVLGKRISTNKASKTNTIDVCFTLAKNILTEPGEKEIYIQIVNPKNNVVADKGAVNFGESSLIYSIKTKINYDNDVKDVCVEIKADKNYQPFAKGTYFVSVFCKNQKLGSIEVVLK